MSVSLKKNKGDKFQRDRMACWCKLWSMGDCHVKWQSCFLTVPGVLFSLSVFKKIFSTNALTYKITYIRINLIILNQWELVWTGVDIILRKKNKNKKETNYEITADPRKTNHTVTWNERRVSMWEVFIYMFNCKSWSSKNEPTCTEYGTGHVISILLRTQRFILIFNLSLNYFLCFF